MGSIDDIPITSDKPKGSGPNQYIGIGISIVALAISILGLVQSRKNAEVQLEVSRPIMAITQSKIIGGEKIDDTYSLVTLWVMVTNIGHLSADINNISVGSKLRFHAADGTGDYTCDNEFSDRGAVKIDDQDLPFAPGSQRDATIEMKLRKKCFEPKGRLHPEVNFKYSGFSEQSVSLVVDTPLK